MARRMLKRINDVTNTADNIIEGNLSHRIPVVNDRNNELDRLGRSLNRMLDRNEELMRSMREVTNNLAHDMRNPLNRIRHRIESAKFEGITEQGFDQLTDDTIRDLDSVISTFNALLSIAQVESGAPRKDWIEFELNALLDDLAEIYELVANEQNLVWEYDVGKDLIMNGNRHLIAQLFTNLLDNAFKYSPEGGKVSLNARVVETLDKKPQIAVTITDNGPGIPAEEHQNVFKRFYRLDNARSTEGNGLGLSLVKAAADLHDAKIEFSDNHPGLCVRVNFNLQR
jgi:signal transduction histidine kinase